jgi:hypothetical protein
MVWPQHSPPVTFWGALSCCSAQHGSHSIVLLWETCVFATEGLAAAKPLCIDTGEVDVAMETDTELSIEKEPSALPLEPLLANSYRDEFAILDGEWLQACRVSSE